VASYTLVRHSLYADGGNADFEDAVQVCELNADQAYRVRAAGGVVFATREAAQAGEDSANYPGGRRASGAHASGYFSSLRIGSAEIYVPLPPPI
jgi:hypothetical protein